MLQVRRFDWAIKFVSRSAKAELSHMWRQCGRVYPFFLKNLHKFEIFERVALFFFGVWYFDVAPVIWNVIYTGNFFIHMNS